MVARQERSRYVLIVLGAAHRLLLITPVDRHERC
jgi:hypothetical protein